jgi:hypothetical protein
MSSKKLFQVALEAKMQAQHSPQNSLKTRDDDQ